MVSVSPQAILSKVRPAHRLLAYLLKDRLGIVLGIVAILDKMILLQMKLSTA